MRKFYGLEICRFLCSICILFWHYQHFFAAGVWTEASVAKSRSDFPLYRLFALAYDHGSLAVQVFWSISGYIFFWKYAEAVHTGKIGGTKFVVLRFSRLYPLHFVTLIYVAVLQAVYVHTHGSAFIYGGDTAGNFAAQLAMASNWMATQPSTFNGPIWSVSAEVVAYFVFFATALAFRPSPLGGLLASLSCLLLLQLVPHQPIVYCLSFFFAGGSVYLSMSRLEPKADLLAYGIAAIVVLALVAVPHGKGLLQSMTAVILCCMTLRAFAALDQVMPFDLSRIGWAGNLTYACYLIHFPLQITLVQIVDWLGYPRTVFHSPLMLLLFLSLTLVGAAIVYTMFEVPAQTLIRTAWRPRQRLAQTKA